MANPDRAHLGAGTQLRLCTPPSAQECERKLEQASKSRDDCTCGPGIEEDLINKECIFIDEAFDPDAEFGFAWRHVTGQLLFSGLYYVTAAS